VLSGFGMLLTVCLIAQFMGSAMGAGEAKLATLIGAQQDSLTCSDFYI